jgi:hypothetical protein
MHNGQTPYLENLTLTAKNVLDITFLFHFSLQLLLEILFAPVNIWRVTLQHIRRNSSRSSSKATVNFVSLNQKVKCVKLY